MRRLSLRLFFAALVVCACLMPGRGEAYTICHNNIPCMSLCIFYDDATGEELRRYIIDHRC